MGLRLRDSNVSRRACVGVNRTDVVLDLFDFQTITILIWVTMTGKQILSGVLRQKGLKGNSAAL